MEFVKDPNEPSVRALTDWFYENFYDLDRVRQEGVTISARGFIDDETGGVATELAQGVEYRVIFSEVDDAFPDNLWRELPLFSNDKPVMVRNNGRWGIVRFTN